MNLKLFFFEIKWFVKLRIWQRIKKYTWCQVVCGTKNRCYPRVDIADEKEWKKHWHCDKCYPCGIGFDYLEGKMRLQGKLDDKTVSTDKEI